MEQKNTTSGGIGFFGILTIVFITLKLTKTIAWSWVWVLSPTWIPFAVFLFVLLICIIHEVFKKG